MAARSTGGPGAPGLIGAGARFPMRRPRTRSSRWLEPSRKRHDRQRPLAMRRTHWRSDRPTPPPSPPWCFRANWRPIGRTIGVGATIALAGGTLSGTVLLNQGAITGYGTITRTRGGPCRNRFGDGRPRRLGPLAGQHIRRDRERPAPQRRIRSAPARPPAPTRPRAPMGPPRRRPRPRLLRLWPNLPRAKSGNDGSAIWS
jgi:hypothetical protein